MADLAAAQVLVALDAALAALSRTLTESGTAERCAREAGVDDAAAAAGRAHDAAFDAAMQIATLRERVQP